MAGPLLAVLSLVATGSLGGRPPVAGASTAGVAPTFSDVTAADGLVQPLLGMYAHAAAFGDVNGDGWQDLLVGTFADYPDADYQTRGAAGRSPDRLLLGGPDGFHADPSFPVTFGRTTGAVFADLENTGYPDLVLVRDSYDDNAYGTAPTVVLHNDHGHFGPPQPLPAVAQGRSAAVLDYDGDGRLDLLVTHDNYFGDGGHSVLLRNEGGLQFADVTAAAGLSGVEGFGVGVGDLNGDGRPDLVIADTTPVHGQATSPGGRIFVANGDGTFHEASNRSFPWTTYDFEDFSSGVAIGDLNLDGRPDVVIGQHFDSTLAGHTAPIHAYLNTGDDAGGDPTFEDVTTASGLPALATKAPDVQIADVDNDGIPDIVTSASAANGTEPAIFHGGAIVDGIPRFSSPAGLGDAQYWLNAALADVDHDGRLDTFVTAFDPNQPSLMLHNDTPGGHWLDVSVTGPGQGVGSRVEVYAAGGLGQPGSLLGDGEVAASSGLGTGSPPSVHVGLGPVAAVDVRVIGPGKGAVRDLPGVAADRSLAVDSAGAAGPTTTTATTPTTAAALAPSPTTATTAPAPTPSAGGSPFVTSFTPTRLRRDFTGWVGMKLTGGPADLAVSSLGRWVVAGNTAEHVVKLVDAATGADVPGGSATVATSGATPETFAYASLPAAVTLRAGATYYLVDQETAGGDAWYDYDTHLVTGTVAADTGAVYAGAGTGWVTGGAADQGWGPLNLLYGGSPPAVPTSTTTTTTTTTAAPAPPPSGATGLVTSFTPTQLRQDFSGWVGMQLTVGAGDLQVSSLGRWVVSGNAATHAVKLVDAATGADVAGGSTTVATAGAAPDRFAYASLPAPVTLRAHATYYLVDQESAGGDAWYDYDTHLVTTGAATDVGAVYAAPGTGWVRGGAAGQGWGPLDLLAG